MTAAQPLVSVILPTRNRADLLRRAVASVLAQTYQNLELIVVNDASTDDTTGVLKEISDPRLKVIHREKNTGAAAARNAGITSASGELFAFQDDDDIWLVQKIEKQMKTLSVHNAAMWCLSGYIRYSPVMQTYIGGEYFYRQLDYRRGNAGKAWNGPNYSLIATPGWLVKRQAFLQSGIFDDRLRSFDDWELGLRLFQLSPPILVDEPLFIQDQTQENRLMTNWIARANDMRMIMEKHDRLWSLNKSVMAGHHYFVGRIDSLYKPAPAGRDHLLKSLRYRPWRLRTWGALVLSYFGRQIIWRVTKKIRQLKHGFG